MQKKINFLKTIRDKDISGKKFSENTKQEFRANSRGGASLMVEKERRYQSDPIVAALDRYTRGEGTFQQLTHFIRWVRSSI